MRLRLSEILEWHIDMTDVGPLVQSHRVVPQLDFEFVEKKNHHLQLYNVQVTKLLRYLKFGLPAAKNLWSNSKPVELAGCWELRLGPALSTDCVLQSARRCAAHPAFSKIHAHKVRMAYTKDK